MSIGVLFADDHPIFREGLKVFLEKSQFRVIGECADGFQALKLAEQLRPDIVLLDLSMPRLNGLDAVREILQVSPRTRAIMLTAHREEPYVLEALRSGAKGYVLKAEGGPILVEAIREVCRGNVYLSPSISRSVVEAYLTRRGMSDEILRPREIEVLRLIADGHTSREIAGHLQIRVKVAESYRTSLMEKLDIHDTANLVRYAVRRGLVKP
ncbi:MAG: response regulator transcription factor [Acidobacteriia bacterium]|nr:response regulator transcription factor [Terriglobia bacterium]